MKHGLAFALLLSAALAFASVAGHVLLRKAKAGDTLKYEQTIALKSTEEGETSVLTLVATVTEKIDKIEGDEISSTVEQEVTKVMMDDEEFPTEGMGDDTKETYDTKANVQGEVLFMGGEDVGKAEYRVSNLTSVIVGAKPIAKGDKWSHTFKPNDKRSDVELELKYEAVEVEKVGEIESVKISIAGKEATGSKPAEVEGFVWLSVQDGSMVKQELKVTNFPMGEDEEEIVDEATLKAERKD